MSQNNIVNWSKNYFLKWFDFKAESNPATYEDSHSFIKYRYTWTVNSTTLENKILFFIENLQLFTEFYSLLSWVRTSQSNDQLLKHEQGHFDLAEFVKQDNLKTLENNFRNKHFPTRGQNEEQRKQYAKEDSGKIIMAEIEKLEQILNQKREEYDSQTNFGENTKKQLEYDLMFDKLRQ